MHTIWAPWRMDYIEGHVPDEADCLFCNCLAEQDGLDNLILHRGASAYVILNRYPYTNGHMMVAPIRHTASIDELTEDEQAALMRLSARAVGVLRRAYGAEAFNLGANIGAAAGAGVLGHVHLHVLPRWSGDTNFMATTATARVIPEALDVTYEKLRSLWAGDS